MKIRHLATLCIVFLMLLSGCKSSRPISISEDEPTSQRSESTSTTTSTTPPPSSGTTSDDSSSEDSSTSENLANEEVSFLTNSYVYGNTNGNTHNNGLATYDFNRKLHYYANKGKIYSYNPETKERITISSGSSNIKYLTLYEDKLFFVAGETQYLFCRDLVTSESNFVIDRTVNYVSRQTTYLYVKTTIPEYGSEDEWFIYYNANTMQRVKELKKIQSVNLEDGLIIFHTSTEPTTLRLMANNMMGQNTIKNFASLGFSSIEHALFLQNDYYDSTKRVFFFILKSDEGEFLYLYEQSTDTITFIDNQYTYHSFNCDDKYLYYASNTGIHVYNYVTKTYERTISFASAVRNINVINRYLYFETGVSDMYRYNLVTNRSELVS